MKKVCVYTCITGDYDEVKEFPDLKEKNIDYYLFTNNKRINSLFWNVIYIENDGLDNIRLARKIKVLGHDILKKYDITIWLDGASYPKKKISDFIKDCCNLEKYNLIGFKHRERDCIYEEAIECVKVKKDKKEVIQKQIEKYKKENYPEHNGLIESTIMVRNNQDENLRKTMKLWLDEILNYSCRDQLSFNYVATKTNLKYKLLEKNVFDNEYFGWEKHNQKKEIKNYSVYFGKIENFDFESILVDEYIKKGNQYIAKFKCPKDTNEIKIEFASFRGIIFSNLKVKGENIENQNLVNQSQYFEYQIFDNEIPTLFLYGNFKKNQKFEISITLELMTEKFYFDLLKKFNIALIQSLSNQEKPNKFTRFMKRILKK